MNRHRVPCESAVCDSTTTEFRFPVPATISTTSAHSAVEHSHDDLDIIKKQDLDDSLDTDNIDSIDLNKYPSTTSEKGPDSTFPESLTPTAYLLPDMQFMPSMPPSYSALGSNNVQNYGAAAPQIASDVQIAREKLNTVSNLPVTILGSGTLRAMSLRLDQELLTTENWEIMAEHMSFTNDERAMFERERFRTKAVIEQWSKMGYHTIGELVYILYQLMDRQDVITLIPDLVLNDAKRHQNASRRRVGSDQYFGTAPTTLGSRSESVPAAFPTTEQIHSTAFCEEMSYAEKPTAVNTSNPVQVQSIQPSEPVQRYDAFVLCNISDTEFVLKQFLPMVEDKAKLKLCLSDRDMPAGNLTFPDQMNYMFERSNKLVVILSDEFFQSKEHEWQSNLAISRDPASRQQRIIPVKYKSMKQRNIFDYLGCCDLTRTMKEEWFWNKIINGIKPGTV